MYPEDRYAVRALKAGASGYLTKESAPDELVSAIRKVAGGGRYVRPRSARKLALELEDNRGKPLHETLSDREYQVMWMIASGKTVRQIAMNCSSAQHRQHHRTRILRKMNMKSNASSCTTPSPTIWWPEGPKKSVSDTDFLCRRTTTRGRGVS